MKLVSEVCFSPAACKQGWHAARGVDTDFWLGHDRQVANLPPPPQYTPNIGKGTVFEPLHSRICPLRPSAFDALACSTQLGTTPCGTFPLKSVQQMSLLRQLHSTSEYPCPLLVAVIKHNRALYHVTGVFHIGTLFSYLRVLSRVPRCDDTNEHVTKIVI